MGPLHLRQQREAERQAELSSKPWCTGRSRGSYELTEDRTDVPDAYGWPHDLSDEEIMERLLALNLERAAGGR